MFDEETEALCKELGIEVWFPPASLRNRCDNKMETVRIGNKAGVPSVPNALSRVESYAHLLQITADAGIGNDLVIQTAFGDSGHTTFDLVGDEERRVGEEGRTRLGAYHQKKKFIATEVDSR